MKTIKVDYFGFEGSGPTVKEAKADAAKKLMAFIKDAEHGPRFLKIEDYLIVTYRTYGTWAYRLFYPGCGTGAECIGMATQEQAEKQGRHHAAQMASTIENVRTDFLIDPQQQQELIDYFAWQKRYREAREEGYCDNDAHRIASGYSPEGEKAA